MAKVVVPTKEKFTNFTAFLKILSFILKPKIISSVLQAFAFHLLELAVPALPDGIFRVAAENVAALDHIILALGAFHVPHLLRQMSTQIPLSSMHKNVLFYCE